MTKISLKDFLKKYSNLSNNFIDDFYAIYDFNESSNNDFIINLEIISKWLNTNKSKLMETLKRSYNLNIDYNVKIQKNNKQGSGGHTKKIILLTPDCFKRLCLLSKTKKAEEVRTYFLELEKLINNYKNYIIEALQSTVNLLENNQKEISQNIKETIYIIRSPKDIDGIYRFGKTQDFKKRLSNYNSANSDKMEVIYIFKTKNSKKIESCVINQIKEKRYKKRKDFYEIDINILKNLISDCNNMTLKYKKSLNQKGKGYNDIEQNLYLYLE